MTVNSTIPQFIQTIVLNHTKRRLLLVQHLAPDSPFANRYTSFIHNLKSPDLQVSMEHAAQRVREQYNVKLNASRSTYVGQLQFTEQGCTSAACPEISIEHQVLSTLEPDVNEEALQATLNEQMNTKLSWHDVAALPYGNMPEDDGVWYPLVLAGVTNLKGEFTFNGPQLESYQLSLAARAMQNLPKQG